MAHGEGNGPQNSEDLASMDAVGTAAAIGSGQVSAAEVVAAAVDRVRAVNPHLNAIAFDLLDAELDHVQGAPFSGVPMFIKDNEDIGGVPTSHGSCALPDRPAKRDSEIVRHYRELGFVILGKTTLPEFGLTASTESDRFGATRNPWDLNYSVGGSSGGSSALVSAGAVPISHANDGGGSIRIPAACTGLVGLKPSRGRVTPATGTEALPINLVAQGAVTRTVRDAVAVMTELEGKYNLADLPPVAGISDPIDRPLRIAAYSTMYGGVEPDPETETAFRATMTLCEGLGHDVVLLDHPFNDTFGRDFLRYWSALASVLDHLGGAAFGRGFDRSGVSSFTRGLSAMFAGLSLKFPTTLHRLKQFETEYEAFMVDYDVLLTPVLGRTTPPIGYLGPDVPFREHLLRLMPWVGYTMYQNVSGGPAMSLPLGSTGSGLPIGMQFAGSMGNDRLLLELALQIEQAHPWQQRAPLAKTLGA